MRLKGHRLEECRWNGERGREESVWTATCTCGWQEEAHSKAEVQREYHIHITSMAALLRAGGVL